MEKELLQIEGIPAVLWGDAPDRLFVAVHGDSSHKEDAAIVIFAQEAAKKGYRTLSFDLPQHGARKLEARTCSVQNAVEDVKKIIAYAQTTFGDVSIFGCSVGAYFSILACAGEPVRKALFLSPLVDLRLFIETAIRDFGITAERLEREREIATPFKTLSWDDYRYVLAHPPLWDKPAVLLYGARDNVCAFDSVRRFAENSHAGMTVMEEGEHYFHTREQLAFFRHWLDRSLID